MILMTLLNEFVFINHNSIYVYLENSDMLALCARHYLVSTQNVYLVIYCV
jgi:hypothetical protein